MHIIKITLKALLCVKVILAGCMVNWNNIGSNACLLFQESVTDVALLCWNKSSIKLIVATPVGIIAELLCAVKGVYV